MPPAVHVHGKCTSIPALIEKGLASRHTPDKWFQMRDTHTAHTVFGLRGGAELLIDNYFQYHNTATH
jgi:hypothetical protein